MRRLAIAALSAAVLAVVAGCGDDSNDAGPSAPTTVVTTDTTAAATRVVRDVLATDPDPPGAPGRTLTLVRYTIAPGAQLPAHVHPGVQMATIESGTLTYTVVSGTAQVTRAGGAVEPLTGPATTTLAPGDDVVETGDMVHFGANRTDQPVVILATLLTEDGRDLAITVTTTTSVPG